MTIPDASESQMLNPIDAPRRAPGHDRPLAFLLPLYGVIFVGFAGYSLMITVFTPMLLRSASPLIPAGTPMRSALSSWAFCFVCTLWDSSLARLFWEGSPIASGVSRFY